MLRRASGQSIALLVLAGGCSLAHPIVNGAPDADQGIADGAATDATDDAPVDVPGDNGQPLPDLPDAPTSDAVTVTDGVALDAPDAGSPDDTGVDVPAPPMDTGVDVPPPPVDTGVDVPPPPTDTGPMDTGVDVSAPPTDTGVDVHTVTDVVTTTCGASGQSCCLPAFSCLAGLGCLPGGGGLRCTPCGADSQPCCPVLSCQHGFTCDVFRGFTCH